ncbi:MAG: DUF4123 domain-containing protein [Minicystis sp.]
MLDTDARQLGPSRAPPGRRVIVEIRGGPLSCRKAILDPGRTLRIGRTDRADLVVPRDHQMSAVHFELTWDGAHCRIRDLGSARSTFLQGERVSDAEVTNGAWIRAGETSLMVYFEGHSPPGASAPAPVEEKLLALHALQREVGALYAVIDASRGARPLQLLRESVDEHRSLYDGVKGEALAHCAPYLVAFRRDSGLLERLVREGWGAGWGIYLSCTRPFDEVRRHFRRFLLVEDDETGQKYYFRFYDPSALRIFVPTCTTRQRQDFFGELACFWAEGEQGELIRLDPEG